MIFSRLLASKWPAAQILCHFPQNQVEKSPPNIGCVVRMLSIRWSVGQAPVVEMPTTCTTWKAVGKQHSAVEDHRVSEC